MPNLMTIAHTSGEMEIIDITEWPKAEVLKEIVGERIEKLPIGLPITLNGTWGKQYAGKKRQSTVIYGVPEGRSVDLPINKSPIAEFINSRFVRKNDPPLRGTLVIVSGDREFMDRHREEYEEVPPKFDLEAWAAS